MVESLAVHVALAENLVLFSSTNVWLITICKSISRSSNALFCGNQAPMCYTLINASKKKVLHIKHKQIFKVQIYPFKNFPYPGPAVVGEATEEHPKGCLLQDDLIEYRMRDQGLLTADNASQQGTAVQKKWFLGINWVQVELLKELPAAQRTLL